MPSEPNTSPRAAVERWADELLAGLVGGPPTGSVRVTAASGGLTCLVLVWPSADRMPTARRNRQGRDGCRADVLAAIRAAGRPLTRKEVVRALKDAGVRHGPGTVAKALADLTASRALINPRDKRGYRLPEWVRPHPTLFPDG